MRRFWETKDLQIEVGVVSCPFECDNVSVLRRNVNQKFQNSFLEVF